MLIIDGTYLVYKSYYVAERIKGNYGIDDEAHYLKIARNVFLKLVSKIKRRFNPSSLFIVFDCEGGNFRHQLLPTYKSNRKDKPAELMKIKSEIYSFLEVHNFTYQIADNAEGDDLIASFVYQNPEDRVMVFTGDADMAALVNENVTLLLEKKKTVQKVTRQNFHHHFPVPAHLFPDFKSLQGDKSDFLKGVDGLFRSEVVHLFMEFHSVEEYFEKGQAHYLYDKIAVDKDKILLNKRVATMKTDCVITINKEFAALKHIYLPDKIAHKVGWK